MISDKQLNANKNNAKFGGVKTEEGKKVIRHNAFKHGLTSSSIISKLSLYEESLDE